jgi:MFS transporter, DHA1 family, multidrug resistance protein
MSEALIRHPSDRSAVRLPWTLVVLLSAISAIGPLSIDMYLPSLPTIAHDLGASAQATQASVTIFLAGMAFGQLFYGPASDRLGRRLPILVGFCVYVAASLASTLTQGPLTLLAARFAQSLGACAGTVIVRAIVRDHFDHQESARFFSLLALVAGATPILAPLGGALLLNLVGWRGIFGVLTAFGAILALTAFLGLRDSRSESVAQHARSEHPLRSYLAVLRERRVVGYVLAGALNGAVLFTYLSSSPAVLIGVYGVSPAHYGVLVSANAIGLIGGSQLNRLLLRHWGADRVLSAATLGTAAATVLLSLAALTGAAGLAGLLVPLFLAIASVAVIQSNCIAGALAVDPLRAGSISALLGASSFACGALAGSLAGALFDGSSRPMALTITACAIGCGLVVRGLALRRESHAGRARSP